MNNAFDFKQSIIGLATSVLQKYIDIPTNQISAFMEKISNKIVDFLTEKVEFVVDQTGTLLNQATSKLGFKNAFVEQVITGVTTPM